MEPRLRNRALLLAALVWVACRTTAPPPSLSSLPDPLAPPLAGATLSAEQTKAARAAWDAARRGDVAATTKRLAKLPAAHPVRRVIALEADVAAGKPAADAAIALAEANPDYAAAWALASVAAEREGRLEDALRTARRALAVRPDGPGSDRVAELETRLVAAGVADARTLLARGDTDGALARALKVLDSVPAADDARLVAVRAALAGGRTAQAAQMLPALPDTPAGLEVKGKVAEALGQWDIAVGFFERLPDDYAGRCELLAGAREQARAGLAPPHVTAALASPAVTRRQLAAILIWQVPRLADKAAGPVPVFEDIVGLGEARDIVLAVRAGVMSGDAVARRFGADRKVTERELRGCLERLARIVGTPAPTWCPEGGQAAECLAQPATLDGKTVAGLVRSVAGQEDNPCSRR